MVGTFLGAFFSSYPTYAPYLSPLLAASFASLSTKCLHAFVALGQHTWPSYHLPHLWDQRPFPRFVSNPNKLPDQDHQQIRGSPLWSRTFPPLDVHASFLERPLLLLHLMIYLILPQDSPFLEGACSMLLVCWDTWFFVSSSQHLLGTMERTL